MADGAWEAISIIHFTAPIGLRIVFGKTKFRTSLKVTSCEPHLHGTDELVMSILMALDRNI